MIGYSTSAIVNIHVKSLLRLKFRHSDIVPYVFIGVPLAAVSSYVDSDRGSLSKRRGYTQTSDPESMRYLMFVFLSMIKMRRDEFDFVASLSTINDCRESFPNVALSCCSCMALNISLRFYRKLNDTNIPGCFRFYVAGDLLNGFGF